MAGLLFGRAAEMSDYDYLNARVRGMSTLLLTREFYEQVLPASTETAPHGRAARLLLRRGRAAGHGRAHGGAAARQRGETARARTCARPLPRSLPSPRPSRGG